MAPLSQTGSETRRSFLGTIAAGGLAASSAGCMALEPPEETNPADDPRTTPSNWYQSVYEAAVPALVEVSSETASMESGQGSGFRLDSTTVVTNAHVTAGNDSVNVRDRDLEWGRATVRAEDVYSDLAVLELDGAVADGNGLTWAADAPNIGTEVIALGAPLGFEGSASTGIVSGLNRSLPSRTGFAIPASIQTDAAIDPGSSGGPLLDQDGEVLGVVFAGAGENIGFAISAAACRQVIPVLAAGETYEHTFVGISHRDVTPGVAEFHELDPARGIYVDEVVPGSPAAGVLEGSSMERTVNGTQIGVGGDILLEIDGVATPTGDHLGTYLFLETEPGDTVSFTVFRDGSETVLEVTLGTRPEPTEGLP